MEIKNFILISVFILIETILLFAGLAYIDKTALQLKTLHNENIAWKQKEDDLRLLQQAFSQVMAKRVLLENYHPSLIRGYMLKQQGLA